MAAVNNHTAMITPPATTVIMLDYLVVEKRDDRIVIGPAPYGAATAVLMAKALLFSGLLTAGIWWFWPKIGPWLAGAVLVVWTLIAMLLFFRNARINRGRFDLIIDRSTRSIDYFDDRTGRRGVVGFDAVSRMRIEHWMNGSWQSVEFHLGGDRVERATVIPPRPTNEPPQPVWQWYFEHGEETLGNAMAELIACPIEHDHTND